MAAKVRIVYLIDQLNIGGTEKQLLSTIEGLDRNTFEPFLVCLRSSDSFKQTDVQCVKQVLHVGSLASFDGLTKLFSFARYLRRHRIDIVQTFFFDSTVFGVLAAKLARVKKVISCRRDMGFWYTPRLLKVLFVVNLLTDRILVNSRAVKENVALQEGVQLEKIDVIYNGIDLEPFTVKYDTDALRREPSIPETDKVVGIVANLNRQVKRVDVFLGAAADILQQNSYVSFVIVGEGCLQEELEQQASDLALAAKIKFVGSQKNVIPYLQLFDVGVLTSESEGLANSIIEYMAVGLPVVCTDVGGNCELVVDRVNGFLVQNYDELSASILRILDCKKQQVWMRQNNLGAAQKFSLENIAEQLGKYYLRGL